MVTPFTDGGELDLDAVGPVTEHLLGLGNVVLVVSGTTGEATTTTDAEKDALLRAVVGVAGGRACVLAGVGTADTAHSVELARAAERAGADGLLVVTPYYSRPSQAGIGAHFTAVADATGLPVMLYDIPGRSAVPIATDTLLRLAAHPRIVAVKDATGDLPRAVTVLAATDLAWWSGADELNLALLAVGAVGVISVVGHVAGARYAALVAAVTRGDLTAAHEIERRLLPLVAALMTPGPGAVTAKAALQLLGVLGSRAVRLPYLAATPAEVARIADALSATGLDAAGPRPLSEKNVPAPSSAPLARSFP
jgi:4-hydroxy-tetrahydrodipicolinate synthase